MKNNMYAYENKYFYKGYKNIAGVDEVGRGCWAGPLVVASVVLPPRYRNDKINDSKTLSTKKREELFDKIVDIAISYSIVEIDENSKLTKINPHAFDNDSLSIIMIPFKLTKLAESFDY